MIRRRGSGGFIGEDTRDRNVSDNTVEDGRH